MTPGSVTIWLSAALAVIAFVSAIRWARGVKGAEETFRYAYHGMTAALALASFFLMFAILAHDFRFHYVVGYTSRDLALLYQVAAFWGGQQGTFLLWALLGAAFGYSLFRKKSWEPAAVMACYMPTILIMIGLMLDPEGNPFRLEETVPPDGRGLNALLQDPWMASHPPVVFLGYVAMSVPAILALVALYKREEDRWVGAALRFTLVGFLSLGTGIVLGGFWAYKVLGWGGYWGWDPVENASLIPWIIGAALAHGLLVQRATGALRRTNLVLAIATYFLVLYSTFLTRTGILANFSVHSFGGDGAWWASSLFWELAVALLAVVGFGIHAFVRRGKIEAPALDTKFGLPLVLTAALGLLVLSAILVFIGTSWPLISSAFGAPSTLGPSYYNGVNLPLYVVVLVLLGIAPFLSWIPGPTKSWAVRAAISGSVGLAAALVAVALGHGGASALLLFFAAATAVAAAAIRTFETAKGGILGTGAPVAHFGFALMLLGVVASGWWGGKSELQLPVGEPVEALGMTFTYRGHVDGSEPKDQWRVAVARPGNAETLAHVSLYNAAPPGADPQIMRTPAILREVLRDVYVAPLGLETAESGMKTLDLTKGTSSKLGDATVTFVKFAMGGGDDHMMSVRAVVELAKGDAKETLELPLAVSEAGMKGTPVPSALLGNAKLTLQRMAVEQGMIRVTLDDGKPPAPETLIVEASTKPLIGFVWIGTFIAGLGSLLAILRRFAEHQRAALLGAPAGIPPRSATIPLGKMARSAEPSPSRSPSS